MTGKIENTPGLINQDAGLINDNTGLIESSTGLIEDSAGLITETNDTKCTASGRRKRSRERGKDSKPRNYPLHTMKNLPQFRDKSHEEFRQHILETKGVDIGSNFNFASIMMPILIVSVIAAGGYVLYWLIKQLEKRRDVKRRDVKRSEIVTNTYNVTYE